MAAAAVRVAWQRYESSSARLALEAAHIQHVVIAPVALHITIGIGEKMNRESASLSCSCASCFKLYGSSVLRQS